MKKLLLLKLSILFVTNSYAQTMSFTQPNPQPNLVEVYAGTFASGDIDGDGDKDLFMIGQTPAILTKLYLNDGTGNFTELAHPFPLSSSGQAILKDLDNDGDLDLYYSGQTNFSSSSIFTRIYRNNGSGVFTQVTNAGLPNILWRGAAIADVDNDGDQDIAMFGTGSGVSGVYLNNGNAVFTPQGNSVFAAVSGAVAFIDMENDGDQDVIISGNSSIKLYQNNGSGIFTLNTNSTFAALSGRDIDVADTDNDGDLDFLVNGNNQNLLYRNNGSGIFTQISTTFQPTNSGQNAIADLDNDGDQDILIVGTQPGGLPHIYNIVYRNTGNNVFVPVDTLGGEYIADCVIDDFTGDGLKDIIIQGFVDDTNVYWNTSSTVLPIELLSFKGQHSEKGNLLTWATASETRNKGFDIESSKDGIRFEKIGFVSGNGSTTQRQDYRFEDSLPLESSKKVIYYRLKQLDFDGGFDYSNIISIRINGKNTIGIFPNPGKDVFVLTGIKNIEDETFTIMNSVGQTLPVVVQDNGQIDMSPFPPGIYYLRMESNGKVTKLIKK